MANAFACLNLKTQVQNEAMEISESMQTSSSSDGSMVSSSHSLCTFFTTGAAFRFKFLPFAIFFFTLKWNKLFSLARTVHTIEVNWTYNTHLKHMCSFVWCCQNNKHACAWNGAVRRGACQTRSECQVAFSFFACRWRRKQCFRTTKKN